MGGGLKTNTTNGPVTVDISNSTIAKNVSNGLNISRRRWRGTNDMLDLSHTTFIA